MHHVLTQLNSYAKSRGWPYQLDETHQAIITPYEGKYGTFMVALRIVMASEATPVSMVLAEASDLMQLEPRYQKAFTQLSQQLQLPDELFFLCDPNSGDVRVTYALPLPEATLTPSIDMKRFDAGTNAVIALADQSRLLVETLRSGKRVSQVVKKVPKWLKKQISALGSSQDTVALPASSIPTNALSPSPPPSVSPTTQERGQALFRRLIAADNQGEFIQQHLDEFTDDMLVVFQEAADRAKVEGQTAFVESTERMIADIQKLRIQSDPDARRQIQHMQQLGNIRSLDHLQRVVDDWPEVLSQHVNGLIQWWIGTLEKTEDARSELTLKHLHNLEAWLAEAREQHPDFMTIFRLTEMDSEEAIQASVNEMTFQERASLYVTLAELIDRADRRNEDVLVAYYEELSEQVRAWQLMV
ncbi:MAG: hypothetical protein AAF639_17455 [Chloroflexota bacterium]